MMQITQRGGKYYGIVRNGDRIVFATPGYYTAGMARADVSCWLAFHGEAKPMQFTPVTVSFTYYAPVADGSTDQRHTASLDCEVPEGMHNSEIAQHAWKLLTRNWDKPGSFMTAKVSR